MESERENDDLCLSLLVSQPGRHFVDSIDRREKTVTRKGGGEEKKRNKNKKTKKKEIGFTNNIRTRLFFKIDHTSV